MRNKSPIISVIIPVFNGSNYLSEAIESLVAQTDDRFEIIVINDGSTDEGQTREVALKYESYIQYFEKDNGGVSSALNEGIRKMKGIYFSWLSHDDLFAPDRIERDIDFFNNNFGAKVICCRSISKDVNGIILRERRFPEVIHGVYEVMKSDGLDMCCTTIHKSCFDTAGMFNEANYTTQDTEMAVKLSMHYDILFNPNTYAIRREHNTRTTYLKREQHQKDRDTFFSNLANFPMEQFFPSRRHPDVEYELLGDLFYNWGYHKEADKFYQKVTHKNTFKIFFVKKFGSKTYYTMINNSLSKSLKITMKRLKSLLSRFESKSCND